MAANRLHSSFSGLKSPCLTSQGFFLFPTRYFTETCHYIFPLSILRLVLCSSFELCLTISFLALNRLGSSPNSFLLLPHQASFSRHLANAHLASNRLQSSLHLLRLPQSSSFPYTSLHLSLPSHSCLFVLLVTLLIFTWFRIVLNNLFLLFVHLTALLFLTPHCISPYLRILPLISRLLSIFSFSSSASQLFFSLCLTSSRLAFISCLQSTLPASSTSIPLFSHRGECISQRLVLHPRVPFLASTSLVLPSRPLVALPLIALRIPASVCLVLRP